MAVFGLGKLYYLPPPVDLDATPNQFIIGFGLLFIIIIGCLIAVICLIMIIIESVQAHKRDVDQNKTGDKII